MDVKKLLKALENESNENMFNFTSKKLRELNLKVLEELNLPKNKLKDFLKRLEYYKYVDEMDDLKYGTYIRWIPLNDPQNIELEKGAIFCEMTITDDGVKLVCKNFGFKSKYFNITFDENLVFQKLTDQEVVLLSALDHLSK